MSPMQLASTLSVHPRLRLAEVLEAAAVGLGPPVWALRARTSGSGSFRQLWIKLAGQERQEERESSVGARHDRQQPLLVDHVAKNTDADALLLRNKVGVGMSGITMRLTACAVCEPLTSLTSLRVS